MKVAEDVYQLKIPMRFNPLGYTFSYYLPASGTLIDTGVAGHDSFQALEKQLLESGAKITDVKNIIPTHFHGDHIGLLKQIRVRSESKVIAHTSAIEKQKEEQSLWKDLPRLTVEEIEAMGGGDITQLFSRLEYAGRTPTETIKVDEMVEDGKLLRLDGRSLRIYWTPGHAREHICLYDADHRILFSGDHVLPKITSHIAMHIWDEHDPLNDYLESLKKIRDLPVDIILPGHERIFTNLVERVEQLRSHHKNRCEEVKGAARDSWKTIYQVSSRIHWDSRPWPQMDFWTKRMAATEAYAHLVYLRNKGEISEEKRGKILYYHMV